MDEILFYECYGFLFFIIENYSSLVISKMLIFFLLVTKAAIKHDSDVNSRVSVN